MKKGIAILCLTALLLSASGISYFYWVEEQLHEQAIFATIDAGGFEQEAYHNKEYSIKLILKEKDQLPEGYVWEEEGREFSYKGMFYDIVSLNKTNLGWELVAASDEEEAAIVANQKTSKKEGHALKISKVQFVFIAPLITKHQITLSNLITKYTFYKTSLFNRSLVKFAPPPEAI